jgi:hypothetical protein
MTGNQDFFSKLAPCDNEIIIVLDNSTHEVHGRGEAPMRVSGDCIKTYKMSCMFLA